MTFNVGSSKSKLRNIRLKLTPFICKFNNILSNFIKYQTKGQFAELAKPFCDRNVIAYCLLN